MKYLLIILLFIFAPLKSQVILTCGGYPLTYDNKILAKDLLVIKRASADTFRLRLNSSSTPYTIYYGDGTSVNYSFLSGYLAKKYSSSNTNEVRIIGDLSKITNLMVETNGTFSDWSLNINNLPNLINVYLNCTNNDSYGDLSLYNFPSGYRNNSLGITANISNWINMTSITANSMIYGGVDKLVNLTYLYSLNSDSRIYGNILAMVNLGFILTASGSSSGLSLPDSISTLTKLGYFDCYRSHVISEAKINRYLADFWTNRDIAKNSSNTQRTITLLGATGTSAPTGQGLIDKANLQGYRSPLNGGSYSLWTVTTR